VGVPIWYVVGILATLAPEIGQAMGMQPGPNAGNAVLAVYAGLAFGDFASGFLSQVLRTRKKVLAAFLLATALGVGGYFTLGRTSLVAFYAVCVVLGVGSGYWAVFVTVASEQFGTNIRATVTTTAPNFVRGSLALVSIAFKAGVPHLGMAGSALLIGGVVLAIAAIALFGLEETYGKDLDFVET
jgi:putative MFS transporter